MEERYPSSPRRSLVASAIGGALLVLSLAACGSKTQAPAASSAPAAETGDVYAVNGEIVRLPSGDDRQIWIRHEAVPDLKDAGGKVIGMESMTMPFDLGSSANPAGLAVGDKIHFRLHVDWEAAEHAVWVDGIEPLPAGTVLSWQSAGDVDEASGPEAEPSADEQPDQETARPPK